MDCTRRKNFSQRRSNFPSTRTPGRSMVEEWSDEFQSDQVISLSMGHPLCLGLQTAGRFRASGCGGRRSAGDLEQNLRGEPQGTPHGNQCSSGRNVPGGGKLKKFFAFLVMAADKYRDRQRQADPFAALIFWLSSAQTNLSNTA